MKPYYIDNAVTVYYGDCLDVLRQLPAASVNCCVTSPPYFGLRDYGHAGQIGLEPTPAEYVAKMVEVFAEVRRVLRDDGTAWANLGDSYAASGKGGNPENSPHKMQVSNAGSIGMVGTHTHGRKQTFGLKPKDLIGIPWRVAFALQADGWYLRQDIIWHKPNPMPESVRDRCTKAHEYIFLLAKSERYYYDADAIKEASVDLDGSVRRYESVFGGDKSRAPIGESGIDTRTRPVGMREFDGTRNRRSVWTVTTKPYSGAHFATFPPDLIDPCVKAGCPAGGIVLDPFHGSGTTGQVARDNGCRYIGIEINEEYIKLSMERYRQGVLMIGGAA